jgi:hypothetical protein
LFEIEVVGRDFPAMDRGPHGGAAGARRDVYSAEGVLSVLCVRRVAAVHEVCEVTKLLAYLAVRLDVPPMCAEPGRSRQCAVQD